MRVEHNPTLADAEMFKGDNFPWMDEGEFWDVPNGGILWHVWNAKHNYWFPCPVGWWVIRRVPGDVYVIDPETFAGLWHPV